MPNTPFITEDAALAYEHFAPLVAAIPTDALPGWPGNEDIIRVNADRAFERIAPQLTAVIASKLPSLNEAEIREIPSLALALTFAAGRVIGPIGPEVKKRQQLARPLRKHALMQLQVLAFQGLVPAERVEAIAANQGAIDEANDAIAIPALFKEYEAALAGKHPFTQTQLEELSTMGNWLKAHLKVKGATLDGTPMDPDAVIRDQLYAELRRRYDEAYKVAVEIWGRAKVDDHIPALLTRARSAPKPKEPVAPADNK